MVTSSSSARVLTYWYWNRMLQSRSNSSPYSIESYWRPRVRLAQYANKIRSVVLGILALQFNIALYLDNIRIGLQNVGIGVLNWVIRFENRFAFGQYPFLTTSFVVFLSHNDVLPNWNDPCFCVSQKRFQIWGNPQKWVHFWEKPQKCKNGNLKKVCEIAVCSELSKQF